MSQATLSQTRPQSATKLVADSFSKSILLISSLLIVQRGIGFLRSFYVCGTLSPSEVGQWDLAFSFLVLAAPLAVFGIPGSFGRYIARYEKNGQQSRFLRHTLVVCLALTLLASTSIWVFREFVGRYFFGDVENGELVTLLAIGLPAVVFFNFATSWFTGKRLNRFVFRIQFTQTLFFAVLCVVTFKLLAVTAISVIVSYLISCLVGTILAASYTLIEKPQRHPDVQAIETDSIWKQILPFAVWIWISNALMNLFTVCDRLLIVNFHPDTNVDIPFLIGQYHTACIFPLLLMTVGAMAGSTGMPYLSADWEAGNREAVNERMNLMLKAVGLICVSASVVILLIAPFLFGELWKDKFSLGESLLPMTLCYCSLAAMTLVAQKYFWCIEKTWLSSSFLLIGLAANFLIGLALIGSYGINGVVASTLISHAIVLVGVLLLCVRHNLKLQPGVAIVSAALFSVCFGKWIALACLVALVGVSAFTPLLFSDAVKHSAAERIRSLRSSFGGNVS